MNDFERKLHDVPLRTPPCEWRAEILAALPANHSAALNWREWLWPPPAAWVALAAVWLVIFAVDAVTTPASAPAATFKLPPSDSLLALHGSLYPDRTLELFR